MYITELLTLYNGPYIGLNLLGILLLTGLSAYTARLFSIPWHKIIFCIIGLVPILIIGGRLAYIVLYGNNDLPNLHFWDLKAYAFSLYGGLLFLVLYLAVTAKCLHIPVWTWLDHNTPGMLLLVVFGKIGCHLNGCCFGNPTLMPWGIAYNKGSQAYQYYIAQGVHHYNEVSGQVFSAFIHPVQLYESALAVLILIGAVIMLKRKLRAGLVFLTAASWYSITRLALYFLRAHPQDGICFHCLPIIYTLISALCMVLFLIRTKSVNNDKTFTGKERDI